LYVPAAAPSHITLISRQTGGRGVDHVIEIGGAGTLTKSLASLRMAGYVHLIGFLAEGGDASKISAAVITTAAILRGISIGSVAQFKDMNRMISANKIRPVVDRVFEFEDLQEAYHYLASQKHVGKVVVKVARD
jgi:NADPH:quinone reductase-like Zn-dependent oxidoreductase